MLLAVVLSLRRPQTQSGAFAPYHVAMPLLIFGVMLRVFAMACSVFEAQTRESLQSTANHFDESTSNLTYTNLVDHLGKQVLYRRTQSRGQSRRKRPTYLYMVAGAESEEPRRKRAGVAPTSAAATTVPREEDDDDLLGDTRPAPRCQYLRYHRRSSLAPNDVLTPNWWTNQSASTETSRVGASGN